MRISDLNYKILIFTVVGTCIFLSTSFLDPFNLPKLLLLSFGALVTTTIWFFGRQIDQLFANKTIVLVGLFYVLALFLIAIASNQDFSRTLLGNFGRNNGFIAYFCLFIVFLQAIIVGLSGNYNKIINALAILSIAQSWYGFLQLNKADFFKFSYSGNPIILTLGNENFSSLFLVLGITAMICVISETQNDIKKIVFSLVLIFEVYILFKMNTFQSVVALFLSLYVFFVVLIQIKKRFTKIQAFFLLGVTVIAIGTAALGLFGSGPMQFLEQNKYSLLSRVYHWIAGWKMFGSKPLFGVGIDSYGDFQPFYRVYQADGTPDTYSNNAHNVIVQYLATGGLVFFIAFMLLFILLVYRLISIGFKKNEHPELVAFSFAATSIFLVHLIVGIDNLGLIVWFWALMGATIGFSYSMPTTQIAKNEKRKNQTPSQIVHSGTSNVFKFSFIIIAFFCFFIVSKETSAHLGISKILIANGNQQLTRNDSDNILRQAYRSDDPDLRMISIRSLYSIGSLDEGYKLALDTNRNFPRNLSILDAKAIYFETKKDFVEAVKIRQAMLDIDPLSVNIKNQLQADKAQIK